MDFFNKLGKKAEEGKEEISTKCEEISKQFDEISKLEAEILSLKEVKKCEKCGAEINKKDDFCSKCGKEQPKAGNVEVKVETTSEIQEVQDAEVTEIKDVPNEENVDKDEQ